MPRGGRPVDLWLFGMILVCRVALMSQRELLDAESVAGHLLKPGSVFAFLAAHRRELFPDEMFADLFPDWAGSAQCAGRCDGHV